MRDRVSNIIFKSMGNIFAENTQAIVNPVNCVGVMGAGLAKAFRESFPKNYKYYRSECLCRALTIGSVLVFEEDGKLIINLPTKDHWKDPSNIEYVSKGLDAMIKVVKKNKLRTVALPALGCGLGGLDWHSVKELLREKLEAVEGCQFVVYEPR